MNSIASIILPTLNEEKNIIILLKKIRLILYYTKYEVIFVDDGSIDNTRKIIIKLSKKYKNVKYIFRNIKNLSTAFLAGLKISKGKYIILMDSDLQHNPSNLKKILTEIIKSKQDIIIGSRFLKNSKNYEKEFKSKFRLILSKCFIIIFKLITKSRLTDPLSGFFAAKKSILINKEKFLFKKGFKIVLDYYLLLRKSAKIKEIPISLNKRFKGKSKINIKILLLIILQILFHIKKIR